MSLNSASQRHLVLFPHVGWGHTRALCNLVARLVQIRPFHVTYVTSIELCERVQGEIRRCLEPGQAGLIRVVAVSNEGRSPTTYVPAESAYADVYKTLVDEEPLTCCHTGIRYPAIPSPSAVFVDLGLGGPLKSVRKFSKKPVKMLTWSTGAASNVLALISPQINIPPRGVREEVLRTGRDPGEVAQEMMENLGGNVLNIPGLPLLYDHELQSQEMPVALRSVHGAAIVHVSDHLAESDGIVMLSVECLERTFLDSLRAVFSEKSMSVHVCGPLIPAGEHAAARKVQDGNSIAILEFMDRILETHGRRSLIHVSFGTWLWPVDAAPLWTFLDVLMELGIPFTMSHASPLAVIPDAVAEKVEKSGLGMLCPWAPQQAILSHGATGWMVTHAGQNSFIEAMACGVPLICWPFISDQPFVALHACVNLDVAFELFEVRSGRQGRGLVHRLGRAPEGTLEAVRREAREVLGRAFGEDGERKRGNALRLKEEMGRAWDADGPGTRELDVLLDLVVGAE